MYAKDCIYVYQTKFKLYKKYFYYTIDNLRMANKEGKVIKTRLCFD